MLSKEEVDRYLQAEQVENWQQICIAAVHAHLPADLRPAAFVLLRCDEEGNPYKDTSSPEEQKRQMEALYCGFQSLTTLDSKRRLLIFSVLAPNIAEVLEATWQRLGTQPYQGRTFRVPGSESIPFRARMSWFGYLMSRLLLYREKEIDWFATWAAYLTDAPPGLGLLFAAAIDAGGPHGTAIFDLLVATAQGKHPTARMCRAVAIALLSSSRPEGWACIEQLLLAAQRQEGLRQVILENVDMAHPQAFRRLLRLILDHDLVRFASVVRAADVWLGFNWSVEERRAVRSSLATLLTLLDDVDQRQSFLSQGNPQQVYFALWAIAFEDAHAAVTAALPLLSDPLAERRLVAVLLLCLLGLSVARRALAPCLADPDLRVALLAFSGTAQAYSYDSEAPLKEVALAYSTSVCADFFERLESLLPRLQGRFTIIESGIWPWLMIKGSAPAILSVMINALEERSPTLLIPYLSLMSLYDRTHTIGLLAAQPEWDDTTCTTLYGLISDRDSWVRDHAFHFVSQRVTPPEVIPQLEALLKRKKGVPRHGILDLLCKESDEHVLMSADRLLTSSHVRQRLAGLNLLHQLSQNGRAIVPCQERARAYQRRRKNLTPDEAPLVEAILAAGRSEPLPIPVRDDVLGLIRPEQCSPRIAPQERAFELETSASFACLRSLDALVEEHRTEPLIVKTVYGSQEMLLGNMASWEFPWVYGALQTEDPFASLPLAPIWLQWERERGADLRDSDGLELLRALLLIEKKNLLANPKFRIPPAVELVSANVSHLHYPDVVLRLLEWLLHFQGVTGTMLDFLLDLAETSLARISGEIMEHELAHQKDYGFVSIRNHIIDEPWFRCISTFMNSYWSIWTWPHIERYWHMLHWLDQPLPGLHRRRPPIELVLVAQYNNYATEADILDQLAGPLEIGHTSIYQIDYLYRFIGREPDYLLETYSVLQKLLPTLRARILEVELARGEQPTEATGLALSLRSGDAALFVRVLSLLPSGGFVRGYSSDHTSKMNVFSHLIRVCSPMPDDTPMDFARMVEGARLKSRHLLAAAIYAPQWAHFIEYVLQWPQFEEAVWWIVAHTRESHQQVDRDVLALWKEQIAKRTSLTERDLMDGTVDIAWFWRCYDAMGAERWEQLAALAKYASSGHGHVRARLFADVMRGKIEEDELVERITRKRMQDAACSLGLLPLPDSGVEREVAIQRRYVVLQEFMRSGGRLRAWRRSNEKRAASIGLKNLTYTANYSDPIRLQWAMEAREGMALRNGPLSVVVGDVRVTLSLDDRNAAPSLCITRGENAPLKSLSATVKKHPEIVALLKLKGTVERQISRMRHSLETAMCRGDLFTAAEVLELLSHPVLSRLLGHLVFLRHAGGNILGYPRCKEGPNGPELSFVSHNADLIQVEDATMSLRLAHPVDLLKSGDWSDWQHECFVAERIQPFKQIFRELYICTANETRHGDEARSWRYNGYQVQPRQAQALLDQRGWITPYGYGEASRTFHDEGVVAGLTFLDGSGTPAEVEGSTLESVCFASRDDRHFIPLGEVPPRLFSEVMRDLDLVVSVAASAGIDPEASTSTVEMRATLIQETCLLLKLQNVKVQRSHTLIEGKLGNYSVHLGSGVVHRQPGGALCIIPVHAQHQGRIFLPFADDDPKTAEVITKIITLARDQEIKDPTILEQLLGAK